MPHILARAGFALLIAAGTFALPVLPAAADADGDARQGIAGTDPMVIGPGADLLHRRGDAAIRPVGDDRRRRFRIRCAPFQAIDQAWDEGLRHAAIATTARSIVVEGRGRYGWGRMVFANMPGCPLIAR